MRPRAKWTRTKCGINPTVGLGLACTLIGLALLVSKALRREDENIVDNIKEIVVIFI